MVAKTPNPWSAINAPLKSPQGAATMVVNDIAIVVGGRYAETQDKPEPLHRRTLNPFPPLTSIALAMLRQYPSSLVLNVHRLALTSRVNDHLNLDHRPQDKNLD